MKDIKHWVQIFKMFSNVNRVKIIKFLSEKKKPMNVTDIAEELDISFKSASKHLILLDRLDVLDSKGKDGHVFYVMNGDMPKDIKRIVTIFT